jgi:hypothetical protein
MTPNIAAPSTILRLECPESNSVFSGGLKGPSAQWLANLEAVSKGKRVRRIGMLVYVVW